jgi:hypothetical protein
VAQAGGGCFAEAAPQRARPGGTGKGGQVGESRIEVESGVASR